MIPAIRREKIKHTVATRGYEKLVQCSHNERLACKIIRVSRELKRMSAFSINARLDWLLSYR